MGCISLPAVQLKTSFRISFFICAIYLLKPRISRALRSHSLIYYLLDFKQINITSEPQLSHEKNSNVYIIIHCEE